MLTKDFRIDGGLPAGQIIKTGRTIQSVDRALDVLEVLSASGTELGLGEIAARSGLNSSTCHHLLSTLVARGYVGQNPRGRGYFLGTKILELSSSRVRQFNLVEVAMPELRRLNQQTRETVHLAVMQGHDLTTLAILDSPHPIRVSTDGASKANAAHAAATGKAILAWLPEMEIARVVAEKGLTAFTDKTITNIADLMEDLRHVRRNGYSLDSEEFQPGVVCVGSAIRDHLGAVIGSIGCSMPHMRTGDDILDKTKQAVRDCARVLSELLGSPKVSQPEQPDTVRPT
ncbi:MAG TPA: IclR family transcriptional regulator [Afifellaceae bacterium]|nr:IclR family transcriptional regulator [Afifellaceae bacterium]